MIDSSEMLDSLNMQILADRRVTIENNSKQLGISEGVAQKNMHDFTF